MSRYLPLTTLDSLLHQTHDETAQLLTAHLPYTNYVEPLTNHGCQTLLWQCVTNIVKQPTALDSHTVHTSINFSVITVYKQ